MSEKRLIFVIAEIIIGIGANILLSYLILPLFLKKRKEYYNINDIYLAIYIGLLFSAIELMIIFFAIRFLPDRIIEIID